MELSTKEIPYILSLVFLLPFLSLFFFSINFKTIRNYINRLSFLVVSVWFLLSTILFLNKTTSSSNTIKLFNFYYHLPLGVVSKMPHIFLLDYLSINFLFLVSLISFFITLFLVLKERKSNSSSQVIIFILFLISATTGLILSGNILSLFIFWELLTITLFSLITENKEKKAKTLSILSIYISDLCLLTVLLLCAFKIESINLIDLLAKTRDPYIIPTSLKSLISILILISISTKASIFPFHFPTIKGLNSLNSINAIVQSSTITISGIYLLIRLLPFFQPSSFLIMAYIGGTSALFGISLAIKSKDIKKSLTYQTISTMGFILVGLAIFKSNYSLLALNIHSFSKAILFLLLTIILSKKIKSSLLSLIIYSISSLSLIGIPFLLNSEEPFSLFTYTVLFSAKKGNWTLSFLIILSSFLTSAYFVKNLNLFFKLPKNNSKTSNEIFPVVILAIFLLTSYHFINKKYLDSFNYNFNPISQIKLYSNSGYINENIDFSLITLALKESEKPKLLKIYENEIKKIKEDKKIKLTTPLKNKILTLELLTLLLGAILGTILNRHF